MTMLIANRNDESRKSKVVDCGVHCVYYKLCMQITHFAHPFLKHIGIKCRLEFENSRQSKVGEYPLKCSQEYFRMQEARENVLFLDLFFLI